MLVVVAVLAAGVGVALGYAAARRRARAVPPTPVPPARPPDAPAPALATAVDALVTGVVVVDADETVLLANPAAAAMGVVRDGRLAPSGLAQLARRARREAGPVPGDVEVRNGRETRAVRALAMAGPGRTQVALLLDDTTEARRIDAVRRDFVANVSHELKTPVGALSLLAEAISGSGDDPESVRRFAERMVVESARLSRLVQELIDLSRLQGAEPMRAAGAVRVRSFVDEAVDRTRLAADARDIEVVVHLDEPDLAVPGDDRQLATAVANLLDNAVAYSPEHTRVGVSARRQGADVAIAVTDQGIGISPADCERIFERFYRVDPARSRETGGTGLGLAIVKHIATNHGGSVDVWSVEGTGSTFTLTLPAVPLPAAAATPTKEGATT